MPTTVLQRTLSAAAGDALAHMTKALTVTAMGTFARAQHPSMIVIKSSHVRLGPASTADNPTRKRVFRASKRFCPTLRMSYLRLWTGRAPDFFVMEARRRAANGNSSHVAMTDVRLGSKAARLTMIKSLP